MSGAVTRRRHASSGKGTIIHLANEMFLDAAGVDVKHTPYKGTSAQIADLIGGQIELGVVALPAVQGHCWFAVVGPTKLPAAQVKHLHEAFVAAFGAAEVKAAMARQENVIAPTSPEAALQFFRSEQERYARLVKKADIKLD